MSERFVLGIDQGSSGSRAVVMDSAGQAIGYGYEPVARVYPQPGWVEQEPRAIAESVRVAAETALARAGCAVGDVVGCGITSQRDTVFAWGATTGAPIGNAITWQDLRTIPLVAEVDAWPLAGERRERLGQFPGPYSSAMHIAWRMRHDPAFRAAAEAGSLRMSLAAGWIVQALGRLNENALDYSLMQAMTVFDYKRKTLWEEWIDALNIPRAALPRPVPTLHDFGEIVLTDGSGQRGVIAVRAMITDQQGSVFGYDCRTPGQAVCTHGTASFVHVVAGATPPRQGVSKVYLAWELDGAPTYAIEADTTVTGAAIRWMQEQMGFITRPAELGPLALSVPDSAGVVFVPAFTGLGVPYEDRSARGTILGMTLDTSSAHIARAFLESLGYQVHDILSTISREANVQIDQLYVGGGVSASDVACQIQADVLGIPVVRASNAETSVRGVGLLAGLGAGLWANVDALPALGGEETTFTPAWSDQQRARKLGAWKQAIERARLWNSE